MTIASLPHFLKNANITIPQRTQKNFVHFVHRQKNIGNYIVDFFISSKRIAIELDGIGHGEEKQFEKDVVRDEDLRKIGITVLRYQNSEINKNFNGVCRDILKILQISEEDLKLS